MDPRFQQLILDYPFKPYTFLKQFGATADQVKSYFQSEIEKRIQGDERIDLMSDSSVGFAFIRQLAFDTTILGFPVGKIDSALANTDNAKKELIPLILKKTQEMGLQYLTYRLSAGDQQMISALEAQGFIQVDSYQIMIRKSGQRAIEKLNHPVLIRDAREEDIVSLQEGIASTFRYSRFFTDSLISAEAATTMHKEWISNSIKGEVAEHVYVAEVEGVAVGFITLEMDHQIEECFGTKMGHIPLIGTNPEYRGRHIGLQLTNYALEHWFAEQQAELIRIETQSTNIPANKTYHKAGFVDVDSAVTLRWSGR